MKSRFTITLLLGFLLSNFLSAQDNKPQKPNYVGQISSLEFVTSIQSRPADMIPSDDSIKEAKDKRSLGNRMKIKPDPQTEDDQLMRKNGNSQSMVLPPPSVVFDAYSSGSQPTDPSLAIGPNHVFVVFNTGFAIYDKAGNELVGQTAPNPAIFPSGGCCDLTAAYDNAADRWVLSFLGSGAQIAVSDGPDPVTANWYVYTIAAINDYQKLSIWSDGYYMTDNTNSANKVWALERDKMLIGDANAQILGFDLPGIATSGFYSPQAFSVTDGNLPAPGGAPIVYMQDNAWGGVSTDHIKLWTVDVDWANTSNSTISSATEITTTPFISVFDGGSFSNLAQPNGGSSVDALQATIMNQAQFRKFTNHNSAVFNFVVDTDASAGELAGVRWIEFRQSGDNQPWSLYQEGTYTAPDGRHAWNASLAMDASGNIGMGYTSMSGPNTPGTVRIGSYYTGRASGDPLGTMPGIEGVIAAGNQNFSGTRYGDYAKIDIDPSDDETFWFITEYMNSGRKGVVGAFKVEAGPPDTEDPTIPTNLSASNITGDGAVLNWTASTDNVGVALYNISIDGNVVGTSTTTSYSVSGLSPLTTYTATVNAQDAAGNNSADASTSFTTLAASYCASTSTNIDDEYISRVQLNTIDNSSGGQFYTDFTSISTSLTEGQTYSVTVTPFWTGTVYNEGYAVWIDYNNDQDFEDTGELVWSQAATNSPTVTGTFTIPAGTAQTDVRMRVSMKYNGVPTSCETFTYGEVEDYSISLLDSDSGSGNLIAGYYFETGLEGWIDGGSDCARVLNTSRSYEGSYSVRLRDNSATSNMVSPTLDLSGESSVTFEFHVYPYSMETGEDFFVEFFDGTSYQTIGNYTSGVELTNNTFFTDIITLNSANYSFNANNNFRLRADASGNGDHVYFDQILINGIDGSGGDNEAPTTPINLVASNETVTSVDLAWNAASDNVAVTGYEVFVDGVFDQQVSGTSATVSGLSSATTYSFQVLAFDAAGNNSGLSSPVSATTDASGSSVIAGYYFETGLEGWIDGGSDCARVLNTSRSYEGSYSVRLRDNSATSNMVSPTLDLSGKTTVTFEFHVFPFSMETGEDFFVEFYDGSTYQTIGNYASGTDFSNNVFFTDIITLSSSNYSFNANNNFRLRADASGNGDHVYFDQIIITDESSAPFISNPQDQNALVSESEDIIQLRSFTNSANKEINIYPNPANSILTIDLGNGKYDEILIFSSNGMLTNRIQPSDNKVVIDVTNFESGMYFARFVSEGFAITKRFVKE